MPRDEDISVVLVDRDDRVTGYGSKLDVHRRGLLHRAFSVFIFDKDGRLLLQRRSMNKYHAEGKWANTVCGHPFAGETNMEAAQRRLHEELGIHQNLTPLTNIYYRQEIGGGMIEHEYVHVFHGLYDNSDIRPDPCEVCETKWARPEDIRAEVLKDDSAYAAWFNHYVREFYDQIFLSQFDNNHAA